MWEPYYVIKWCYYNVTEIWNIIYGTLTQSRAQFTHYVDYYSKSTIDKLSSIETLHRPVENCCIRLTVPEHIHNRYYYSLFDMLFSRFYLEFANKNDNRNQQHQQQKQSALKSQKVNTRNSLLRQTDRQRYYTILLLVFQGQNNKEYSWHANDLKRTSVVSKERSRAPDVNVCPRAIKRKESFIMRCTARALQ